MNYDPKSGHYDLGGFQAIDVIKSSLGLDGFISYCHGNVLKYSMRANNKGDRARDIEKAGVYRVWMAEAIEEQSRMPNVKMSGTSIND